MKKEKSDGIIAKIRKFSDSLLNDPVKLATFVEKYKKPDYKNGETIELVCALNEIDNYFLETSDTYHLKGIALSEYGLKFKSHSDSLHCYGMKCEIIDETKLSNLFLNCAELL